MSIGNEKVKNTSLYRIKIIFPSHPPPEVPYQNIYLICGGEVKRESNRGRKMMIRSAKRTEVDVMEVKEGGGVVRVAG